MQSVNTAETSHTTQLGSGLQDLVGTLGYSCPGVTWRLAAMEEMGYDPMGQPARGELCLQGGHLFSGYHQARPVLCCAVLRCALLCDVIAPWAGSAPLGLRMQQW